MYWTDKPETVGRVRMRVEAVLDYAIAMKARASPNPAAWKGNLDVLLPQRSKVRSVTNHPALPWRELPAFMAALRERDGMGSLALRFTILIAARSGEVRGATWSEIDLEQATWTIPAHYTSDDIDLHAKSSILIRINGIQ